MKRLVSIMLLLAAIAIGAQAKTYKLWVASTQVTDANKDDILGDERVSFDPSTNTMTLDGATIIAFSGTYGICNYGESGDVTYDIPVSQLTIKVLRDSEMLCEDQCLYFRGAGVTITGRGKLKLASDSKDAITVLTGTLTFADANVWAEGNDHGICGKGSGLFVDHSSLEIGSFTQLEPTIYDFNYMTMTDCKFGDADFGSDGFWEAGGFYYDDNVLELWYIGNYYDGSGYEPYDGSYCGWVFFEPTMKTYDLKVNGVSVTDDNKDDVLGDKTVSFDHYSSTLTLQDADITSYRDCILNEMNELTILFKGTNRLVSTGIWENAVSNKNGNCKVYLTGPGSASIKAVGYGIMTYGTLLSIGGGLDLSVEAEETAIEGNSFSTELLISDAGTVLRAFGSHAVVKFKKLTLGTDVVLSSPEGASYDSNKYFVKDKDGNEVTNDWVIFRGPYALWVKGVQVTESNKNDILGDKKVRYDSDRNYLILNNADITYNKPCIENRVDNLVVFFGGDNKLTSTGEYDAAIENRNRDGRMTLSGSGSVVMGPAQAYYDWGVSGLPVTLNIEGGLQIKANGNFGAVAGLATIMVPPSRGGTLHISGNGTEVSVYSRYDCPVRGFSTVVLDGALEVYSPADAYFSDDDRLFHYSDGTLMSGNTTLNIRMPAIPIDADHFPDPNFRSLVHYYDEDSDGYIDPSDIRAWEEMDFGAKDIEDLTGIEYFDYQEVLDFSANKIKTVDLSKNKRVVLIYAWQNQISGANMDYFVNHLPEVVGGEIYIYIGNESKYPEANEMTPEQVAKANAKGWTIMLNDERSRFGEWVETKGFWLLSEERFPDDNLRDFMRNGGWIERCTGALTYEDVEEMDYLNLEDLGIKDFTGIEYFAELTEIECNWNEVTTIDFSGNPKLHFASIHQNQIRGEGMDRLIASLPKREVSDHARLHVIDDDVDYPETNELTPIQAAKAKAKGWMPMTYDYDLNEWVEYTAGVPVGIHNATTNAKKAPAYNLSGQRIMGKPTQRGVYISNGKKVVVK